MTKHDLPDARTVHRDLPYGDNDRQVLDLYRPPQCASGQLPPLVLFIHGGRWREGDKGSVIGLSEMIASGFAVASMNYRLTPTHRWPAQLEDVQTAISFLKQNGASYGVDAGRMASFGAGAGGHLAVLAGLTCPDDFAASVIWYPPVEFDAMDTDMKRTGVEREGGRTDEAGSAESELVGAVIGSDPAAAALASPLTYLARLAPTQQIPDFLIMHGGKDPCIGRGQSARLAYALSQHMALGRLELAILPDGTHGGGGFGDPDVMARVSRFMKAGFERKRKR